MTYVLDTSGLVGAWRRKYPPEHFPSLWENLDVLGQKGRLFVPEEVVAELKKQDDDLFAWVTERGDHLVVPTSRAVLLAARAILNDHPRLTMEGTGRGRADPFVIAEAQARGCAVVTEERGGTRDAPRIPYVCSTLDVDNMEMLGIIQGEGWTFY